MVDDLQHVVGEALVAELQRRDIHRNVHRVAGPRPRGGFPARLAHDRVRQRLDQAALLRDRNEAAGTDDGAVGPHPARQSFRSFDATSGEIDLGLEKSAEFVALQAAARFRAPALDAPALFYQATAKTFSRAPKTSALHSGPCAHDGSPYRRLAHHAAPMRRRNTAKAPICARPIQVFGPKPPSKLGQNG